MCQNGTTDNKGRLVLDAIQHSFLTDSITFPTHVRGNKLDLALSNISESIISVTDLGPVGSSDHSAIKLEIDFNAKFDTSTEKVRDWKRGDENGLKNHFENVNFHEIFQGKNANECWIELRSQIDVALDRYIPLTDRRRPGQPPWFNKNIKRLCNRKRRHWRKFKSDRSPANFDLYKRSESELKKAVQSSKRSFERKIANSGNKRPFNQYVKSKSKARSGIGPLRVQGELITDNKSMASALNGYFVSVFTEEGARPIPPIPRDPGVSSLSRLRILSDKVLKKNCQPKAKFSTRARWCDT